MEKTVTPAYYNTDYVYIRNSGSIPYQLEFELITENRPSAWHASVCSGAICYFDIPSSGIIGTLNPDEEGYLAFNLSTNETVGDGEFSFRIFDKTHPEISDTLTFFYHAETGPEPDLEPWVRLNYQNGILTILLKNEQYKTELSVYDLHGNRVRHLPVESITSIRASELAKGIYVILITDESGRTYHEKIVNSGL